MATSANKLDRGLPSREFRDAIFARAPLNELKEMAEKNTYHTFRQDGLIKTAEGLTSYEEIAPPRRGDRRSK